MASYLYTYGVYSGAGLLDNCSAIYIVFWKIVRNQNYKAILSLLLSSSIIPQIYHNNYNYNLLQIQIHRMHKYK